MSGHNRDEYIVGQHLAADELGYGTEGVQTVAGAPASAGSSFRSRLIRTMLVGLCMLVAAGGCGKKITRHGVPFDLDSVFAGKQAPLKESWKEQGMRQAKEGDFEPAIEAFTKHVVEEPESFFGFNAIAICYKNMGDHTKAMQNFERALEFADDKEEKAKVFANMGNLYFAANSHQVALGYYKEAAAEFEKNPLYLILIARTFASCSMSPNAHAKCLSQPKTYSRIWINMSEAMRKVWDIISWPSAISP